MKICKKCKESKDLSKFTKRKNGKNGLKSICAVCERKYHKEYRASRPNWWRKYGIFNKFNLTLDQYDDILLKQNSVCAICKNPETAKRKNSNEVKYLAVDHCHKTGKIRGLLCSLCNTGIGKLKDDIKILENAIEYLKQ